MHFPASWPRHTRVYVVQVLVLMVVLYPALLIGFLLLAPHIPPGGLRTAIAVVPAVPVLLLGVAIIRFVRQSDELQRRIQIEAMAAGFFAMLGVGVTAAFLQLGGQPPLTPWASVVAGGLVWGAAVIIQQLRYR